MTYAVRLFFLDHGAIMIMLSSHQCVVLNLLTTLFGETHTPNAEETQLRLYIQGLSNITRLIMYLQI